MIALSGNQCHFLLQTIMVWFCFSNHENKNPVCWYKLVVYSSIGWTKIVRHFLMTQSYHCDPIMKKWTHFVKKNANLNFIYLDETWFSLAIVLYIVSCLFTILQNLLSCLTMRTTVDLKAHGPIIWSLGKFVTRIA